MIVQTNSCARIIQVHRCRQVPLMIGGTWILPTSNRGDVDNVIVRPQVFDEVRLYR